MLKALAFRKHRQEKTSSGENVGTWDMGVFSAETIPISLNENTFINVNSENSYDERKRCLLICNKDGVYLFGDPLVLRLEA